MLPSLPGVGIAVDHLTRPDGRNQIRISKSEIRNKFKIRKPQCSKPGRSVASHRAFGTFGFRICFVFRASDFVFPRCARRARILRTETLTRLSSFHPAGQFSPPAGPGRLLRTAASRRSARWRLVECDQVGASNMRLHQTLAAPRPRSPHLQQPGVRYGGLVPVDIDQAVIGLLQINPCR